MKTKNLSMTRLLPFLFLAASFMPATAAFSAQNDVSMTVNSFDERLERDIGIVEGILRTLLDDEKIGTFRISSIYLPENGLIFSIDRRPAFFGGFRFPHRSRERTGESGNDEVRETEPEERLELVREKLYDFFVNYAVTLQSLPENEHLYITYRDQLPGDFVIQVQRRPGGQPAPVIRRDSRENGGHEAPALVMSAGKRDINAFRREEIDEAAYRNRIAVHQTDEEAEYRDLRIMAGILQTSLESESPEILGPRGAMQFSKIPGLGAVFTFQAGLSRGHYTEHHRRMSGGGGAGPLDAGVRIRTYSSGDALGIHLPDSLPFIDEELQEELLKRSAELREELAQLREQMKEHQEEIQKKTAELQAELNEARLKIMNEWRESGLIRQRENQPRRERRQVSQEEIEEAFEVLEHQLAGILADYGRTLQSVSSDEFVIIHIRKQVSGMRREGEASSITLSVRKSDLEAPDREEILENISIRRF